MFAANEMQIYRLSRSRSRFIIPGSLPRSSAFLHRSISLKTTEAKLLSCRT